MNNKLMKSLLVIGCAVVCAVSVQAQESFEEAMRVQSGIDFGFKMELERHTGLHDNIIVMTSSHYASVTAFNWRFTASNYAWAKAIAQRGLAWNPESTYFEAHVTDDKGSADYRIERGSFTATPAATPIVIRGTLTPEQIQALTGAQ
jgi:predicted mannosyl-3-phosphoglycerate phosphatase (HAD superfamily)